MTYRIRLHPAVAEDLQSIAGMITDYAGPEAAKHRLAEIESAVLGLADTPHKGSLRDEIAPGLRAIPAGRKAVVAFTVDDPSQTVFVHIVGYAGSNWVKRAPARGQ
ncbi:UNVERIFIED_CONTAM: type II toxin-antitoxin system RelE/ParE family toxin [Spiribacter pallidus]|uniref:type II toxin-antitoxin system RelE/ParE family toxin n=1 Tax=Spiribacter pallidus TaxID=1987936 RepID=UPI00349FD6D3